MFRGDGRVFLHTSGAGVVSQRTLVGDWSEDSFAEDDPHPEPIFDSAIRMRTENMVRDAACEGFRSIVIRPPMIWGHGGSIQVPRMFDSARQMGAVCYLGRGLNLYSNVHVDDLAEAFALAIDRGVGGALYNVVAGEANFRTIAEAIGEVTGCGTRSMTYLDACDLWGSNWVDLAIAVNSRIRAPRARSELGWAPIHTDLIDDIRSGSYAETFRAKRAWASGDFAWSGAHGNAG